MAATLALLNKSGIIGYLLHIIPLSLYFALVHVWPYIRAHNLNPCTSLLQQPLPALECMRIVYYVYGGNGCLWWVAGDGWNQKPPVKIFPLISSRKSKLILSEGLVFRTSLV